MFPYLVSSVSEHYEAASLLSVNVCDLPACSTLIFRHLSRDAESMTELRLAMSAKGSVFAACRS